MVREGESGGTDRSAYEIHLFFHATVHIPEGVSTPSIPEGEV